MKQFTTEELYRMLLAQAKRLDKEMWAHGTANVSHSSLVGLSKTLELLREHDKDFDK